MTERRLGTNGYEMSLSRARWRRRGRGRALRNTIVLALVSVGWSSVSPPAGASEVPGPAASQAGPVWVCRPAQAADPCASDLAVSAVTATGAVKPATWPRSALASKFECFYVLPTNSLATTPNTGLTVTTLETFIAVEQAAPLSTVCNVWAPVYRSQTWTSVREGLAGNEKVMTSTFKVAYQSVLPAWDWFVSHTGGEPVVLVGDSQGSAVLIHLISAELDHEPSVLRRLVVAVLVGGNLQVPIGKTVGATFTKVPLCTSSSETTCAIAFSSYPSEPPANAVFGRPGQGTSLQSGQTAKAGQQVACVNPTALAGGTADLDPYVLTASQPQLTEHVATPWVTYPGLYSASCKRGGGASWLQVTSLAGTSGTRPVVNDKVVGNYGGGSGPAWGYHSYEYGLTLGNLLQDVNHEEAKWPSRHLRT
ncbi:MAG TPA: DUF3089 domain-containing protein [Acidimicrobiales bacterium]|nr:DUF3089 domain-containing protein [Acidimicrobiales bacterium]